MPGMAANLFKSFLVFLEMTIAQSSLGLSFGIPFLWSFFNLLLRKLPPEWVLSSLLLLPSEWHWFVGGGSTKTDLERVMFPSLLKPFFHPILDSGTTNPFYAHKNKKHQKPVLEESRCSSLIHFLERGSWGKGELALFKWYPLSVSEYSISSGIWKKSMDLVVY